MTDCFIIFFKDKEDVVNFYDIKLNSSTHRDIIIEIMNIEEIDYSISSYKDLIVTDKAPIVSQFVTSAGEIFSQLGIKVVYLRKCRVYSEGSEIYDKMTEDIFNLDDYLDYREQLCIPIETHPDNDKSTHKIDIFSQSIEKDFDEQELVYYRDLFRTLGRNPTYTEYFDLLQSNSEHSRHWFFNGKYFRKNKETYQEVKDKDGNTTLMRMIKATLYNIDRYLVRSNSLVAFRDNSSVIKGADIVYFTALGKDNYYFINRNMNPVLTAETHNFPTLISPFHGAHTGVGGRIRDNQATGLGAVVLSSLAGYCVGDIKTELNGKLTDELKRNLYGDYETPLSILIKASDGASDYGNKFGEPIIGGFTRSFTTDNIVDINGYKVDRIEWVKPIMFSAGVGAISEENLYKKDAKPGMLVIRIGGPAYKIGLGGGYASSLDQDSNNSDNDQSAVQRGDPEMCTKMNNVLRYLIDNKNIIVSIHDQGSGGLGNVVKEIVHPYGADIQLDKVTLGDKTMDGWEIWSAEFQESNVLLIDKLSLNKLEFICKRENISLDVLGTINNSAKIRVEFKEKMIMDLPLNEIVKPTLQKEYVLNETSYVYAKTEPKPLEPACFYPYLSRVLQNLDVCSKRFLVNKVDRSVTGLVVQQQCVGKFQTPISNYSLTATSYFNTTGIATAIGDRPILTLLDSHAAATMTIGEMLTNMMGVYVGPLTNIKCSGNWMWALTRDGESDKLVKTAMAMTEAMRFLGLAIDGGKDSLSMGTKIDGKEVFSPNNLVLTGYAHVPDFTKRVTPDLKNVNSYLVYISVSNKQRIGGSVFQREHGVISGEPPSLNIDELVKMTEIWELVQTMIYRREVLSLHDVSDGGLITTITEMAIAGDIGVELHIEKNNNELNNFLFNEEIGIVLELKQPNVYSLCEKLKRKKIPFKHIGRTKQIKDITIKNFRDVFFCAHLDNLREFWEVTSNKLEYKQMEPVKAKQQEELRYYSNPLRFTLNSHLREECYYKPFCNILRDGPKVAVIRCEGSNGHRELAAAFSMARFSVTDIHINDLIETPELLESFKGIAFPGGFSYSDTFGAAKGWGSLIVYAPELLDAFKRFYNRSDTFSIGICNGCQLMVNFNLLNLNTRKKSKLKLVQNDSKRFESRFTTVKVTKSKSIFFKRMEDVEFGMWVAHGEGKFVNVSSEDNIALQYTLNGEATRLYPYNPNGSERGTAAVCSDNGRHLAIMPHPERCFLDWQLPYKGEYENYIKESPWVYIFRNAYNFVKKQTKKLMT
jgi:phosphoribosylformylglycinamidine synthase